MFESSREIFFESSLDVHLAEIIFAARTQTAALYTAAKTEEVL